MLPRTTKRFVKIFAECDSLCAVQGSGFRVQGSGRRVQGSRFRVQGSGSRVQGSGFGAMAWLSATRSALQALKLGDEKKPHFG